MHGLVFRSFESFILNSYGQTTWIQVADKAGIPRQGLQSLAEYDDELALDILDAASETLGRPGSDILEDLGTFLVSNPTTEALRRLLRFGGASFAEFLQSLDELPDRARLAVSDLVLPQLELRDNTPGSFNLTCYWDHPGPGHVLVGMLRTMADDYGALVLLEYVGADNGKETISIKLLDQEFTQGRDFHLAV
ncbi:MAG: heme NO-binding domain-containing protein [Mangrovicoccus sp.]|nr:heme NO-binding domain-containing protein [Mangrovicoccus sp.]